MNPQKEKEMFLAKFGKQGLPTGVAIHESKDGVDITLHKIADYFIERMKERDIWAVKITISKFSQMNLEDPNKPVNIDEVKRRAIETLSQDNQSEEKSEEKKWLDRNMNQMADNLAKSSKLIYQSDNQSGCCDECIGKEWIRTGKWCENPACPNCHSKDTN